MTSSTPEPTPSLAEYRRQAAEDSNVFWRLSSGDHENLLDEAIEENDRLRDELAEANKWIYWSKRNTASAAEQHKRHYDEHDEAREAWQQVRDEMTSEILDLREDNRALAARIEEFAHLQDRIPDTENGEWSLGWDVGYNAALAEVRAMAARPIDFTEDARESATTPPEGDRDE